MLNGRTGILRTLPAPDSGTIETLRRHAAALGVAWPADFGYSHFIRSLEPANPAEAALVAQAARLFRGAGYLGFHGSVPDPEEAIHAAVAGHYAHVTAPLRRLVDRFGNAIVLAQGSGVDPPAWATEALAELPALMQAGRHREAAASGMALDLVEAAVLSGRTGEVLSGVVTDAGDQRTRVQVVDPAVVVTIEERGLRLGQEVRLRVAGADLTRRTVDLHLVTEG
jgi:exoribonuclease R